MIRRLETWNNETWTIRTTWDKLDLKYRALRTLVCILASYELDSSHRKTTLLIGVDPSQNQHRGILHLAALLSSAEVCYQTWTRHDHSEDMIQKFQSTIPALCTRVWNWMRKNLQPGSIHLIHHHSRRLERLWEVKRQEAQIKGVEMNSSCLRNLVVVVPQLRRRWSEVGRQFINPSLRLSLEHWFYSSQVLLLCCSSETYSICPDTKTNESEALFLYLSQLSQ